jgi:hypothetical protein
MKQLIIFCVVCALFIQCKDSKTDRVKDPEAALRALPLKSVRILKKTDAEQLIRNSFDSSSKKKDFVLGMMSFEDLKEIQKVQGLKKIYYVIGRYTKADSTALANGPTCMVALSFEGDTSTSTDILVYGEIKVCPPPDGSVCLKELLGVSLF